MKRVLVLGGTSEIAGAIVRELAARDPCEVALAGRDAQRLGEVAQELRGAGCARVQTLALEATTPDSHRAALARGIELLGGACDLVLLAVGQLGERGGLPDDLHGAVEVLEVNMLGCGSLLLESARALRAQGRGTIVVLSSVAAERPRAANAVLLRLQGRARRARAGARGRARGHGSAGAGRAARVRHHANDTRPAGPTPFNRPRERRPRHRAGPAPRRAHRVGPRRVALGDGAPAAAAPPAVPEASAVSTQPRRRAAAARARRRRLRLFDLALGIVLALAAIVLAPGLAVVALLAAGGLLLSTASFIIGRVRRRRLGNC